MNTYEPSDPNADLTAARHLARTMEIGFAFGRDAARADAAEKRPAPKFAPNIDADLLAQIEAIDDDLCPYGRAGHDLDEAMTAQAADEAAYREATAASIAILERMKARGMSHGLYAHDDRHPEGYGFDIDDELRDARHRLNIRWNHDGLAERVIDDKGGRL